MTKLLRYEDRKSGIDYYGLSDNEFFKNKKTVVVSDQTELPVDDDELKKEIDRSKAMNGIAHTIVDNARVVLDANKFMDTREDSNLKLPRMIGVKEDKEHD